MALQTPISRHPIYFIFHRSLPFLSPHSIRFTAKPPWPTGLLVSVQFPVESRAHELLYLPSEVLILTSASCSPLASPTLHNCRGHFHVAFSQHDLFRNLAADTPTNENQSRELPRKVTWPSLIILGGMVCGYQSYSSRMGRGLPHAQMHCM